MPLRNVYDEGTEVRIEDTIRAEFVTPEEEEQREQLRAKIWESPTMEEMKANYSRMYKILDAQVTRYVEARMTKEAILADVEAILAGISKETWEKQLEWSRQIYEEELKKLENDHNEQYGREATPEYQRYLDMLQQDSTNSLYSFLAFVMQYRLIFQVNALARFTTPRTGLDIMLLPLAEKRYKEFYPDYESKPAEEGELKQVVAKATTMLDTRLGYMPMFHGYATDALSRMSSREIEVNAITGAAIIKTNNLEVTIKTWDKLQTTLGINEHKLLSVGAAEFTRLNGRGATGDNIRNYRASFPLKEYALKCGYKVEPILNGSETPEEVQRETTRAKNALKDARKKIKKSLNMLYDISLTGSEKVRNTEISYRARRLLSGIDITASGFIQMTFGQDFAEYLTKLPIMHYPEALLKIDARNPNAYSLGLQMSEHFSNYNNQGKGTAQSLKVKTLLEYTSLPSIETVIHDRNGWEGRIKERLEDALDYLTQVGVLTDWRYSKPKGEELPDEEAVFSSFEEWEQALVFFTLKNGEELAGQINESRKQSIERTAKATEKRKTKKTKAKK